MEVRHETGMREVAAVLAAAEQLGGTLAVAEALLESGRCIELAGLEREIAALCAAAMLADPAAAPALRAALGGLVARLDRLRALMRPPP